MRKKREGKGQNGDAGGKKKNENINKQWDFWSHLLIYQFFFKKVKAD